MGTEKIDCKMIGFFKTNLVLVFIQVFESQKEFSYTFTVTERTRIVIFTTGILLQNIQK